MSEHTRTQHIQMIKHVWLILAFVLCLNGQTTQRPGQYNSELCDIEDEDCISRDCDLEKECAPSK